jgi:hypothetical protein
LPSSRKVNARATTAETGQTIVAGYEESTSLEPIAEWLAKIVVGLTLTQFAS